MIAVVVYFTLLLVILGVILYKVRSQVSEYTEGARSYCNGISEGIPIEWEIVQNRNVPLITLNFPTVGRLTFLVDSGASHNYIDSEVFSSKFNPQLFNTTEGGTFYGVDGTERFSSMCNLSFTYRRSHFEDEFLISDLSTMTGRLSTELKVKIVGVIGVSFLKKYGLSIDLGHMIVWKKQ